jgi:hypothetical protein
MGNQASHQITPSQPEVLSRYFYGDAKEEPTQVQLDEVGEHFSDLDEVPPILSASVMFAPEELRAFKVAHEREHVKPLSRQERRKTIVPCAALRLFNRMSGPSNAAVSRFRPLAQLSARPPILAAMAAHAMRDARHAADPGSKVDAPTSTPLTQGVASGFPTERRPRERQLSTAPQSVVDGWFEKSEITIGTMADTPDLVSYDKSAVNINVSPFMLENPAMSGLL